MPKQSAIQKVPIADIIHKKEEMGLQFFKECINKTNQFSAQYILNKLLHNYTDHVNELRRDLDKIPQEGITLNIVSDLEKKFSPKDLCIEFDLSTLTFLEAAKIVIRMAEKDIDFYKYFIDRKFNKPTEQALKRIVAQKTEYVETLRDEYSRLDYHR